MSPESQRGQERPRTLFGSASNEEMLNFSKRSINYKVVDALYNIIIKRSEYEPTTENQTALEQLDLLRERAIDAALMDLDLKEPDTEELWLIEEENIRLFKPIGE